MSLSLSATFKWVLGGAVTGTVGRWLIAGDLTLHSIAEAAGYGVATAAFTLFIADTFNWLRDIPVEAIAGLAGSVAYLTPRALALVASLTFRAKLPGGVDIESDGDVPPRDASKGGDLFATRRTRRPR